MQLQQAQTILEAFFSAADRNEDCFDLDQYHGALTAALSCPEPIRDGDLALLVLGEDYRDDHPWFEDDEIYTAQIIFENELGEALALKKFDLLEHYPQNPADKKPSEKFSRWCQGYLHGYTLTEEIWQEAYKPLSAEGLGDLEDNHAALIDMIAAVADWEMALAESEDPQRLLDNTGMLFDTIKESILDISQLALALEDARIEYEAEHQTYTRPLPKTGRNDPCPCGSGKKYKKCCLSLLTEHGL